MQLFNLEILEKKMTTFLKKEALPYYFQIRISNLCVSQVYIVAVERSRQRETSVSSKPSDCSGSETGAEGLLKLVQSDLSTLSRLWLAALQDYALLTLPQEYASQLPATGRRLVAVYFSGISLNL